MNEMDIYAGISTTQATYTLAQYLSVVRLRTCMHMYNALRHQHAYFVSAMMLSHCKMYACFHKAKCACSSISIIFSSSFLHVLIVRHFLICIHSLWFHFSFDMHLIFKISPILYYTCASLICI